MENSLSVPDADILIQMVELLEVPVSQLLGAEPREGTEQDLIQQLAQLNEELATYAHRERITQQVNQKLFFSIGVNLFIVPIGLYNGGSGGGQDILGVLHKKMQNFSVGKMGLIINAMVYAVCAVLFDLSVVIYSVIYAAILSIALDKTHSQNIQVRVDIYTKHKSLEIRQYILEQRDRGSTCWDARGGFTDSEAAVISTVLSKYEVSQLLRYIHEIDDSAFVVVNNGIEVGGNFFKKL